MKEFNSSELKNQYLKWYRENLTFKDISNNLIRIDSPFKDSGMDDIVLYASYNPNNHKIKLTDDGYTVFNLEMHGINIKNSKKRKSIFSESLSSYGVQFDDNTEEIYVETIFNNFSKNKHRLLQCLIFINDMYILAKPTVEKIFTEDVATKLDQHEIVYSKDLPLVSPSGMVHKFDFVIPAPKNKKEKFIKAIAAPNNNLVIKATVTDVNAAKNINRSRDNQFICILNDTKNSVNIQMENYLNESGIKTMNYSEMDEKINLIKE
ncbi:DUF1828 domain-containing protein [Staphylococcus gallinarum]|uniref:DUF1828 domain-containing protein n=1 Tax=Staphylococcus gallinarum TaxID=1293 RepID=UPI002DBF45C7|nr:DUF1828 domain-containing protein [Staphylococcus gallinarum]MEB6242399.1 DUF1828 domain-containing protein [Staphylococcus gallinarum]MEB6295576.1 DUF1828 domain-containing protein [Staphylococcus gallinarum]